MKGLAIGLLLILAAAIIPSVGATHAPGYFHLLACKGERNGIAYINCLLENVPEAWSQIPPLQPSCCPEMPHLPETPEEADEDVEEARASTQSLFDEADGLDGQPALPAHEAALRSASPPTVSLPRSLPFQDVPDAPPLRVPPVPSVAPAVDDPPPSPVIPRAAASPAVALGTREDAARPVDDASRTPRAPGVVHLVRAPPVDPAATPEPSGAHAAPEGGTLALATAGAATHALSPRMGDAPWTSAGILLAGALLFLLPYLLLYRRIERNRLMESGRRQEILAYVAVHPGATAAEVAEALGVYYNTARHHLDILSEFGALTRRGLGQQFRYFENHGRYSPEEQRHFGLLAHDENAAFLRVVARFPGLSQSEARVRLDLAKSTVSKRVRILVEAGLLARDGNALRLTPEGARALTVAAPPAPVTAPRAHPGL